MGDGGWARHLGFQEERDRPRESPILEIQSGWTLGGFKEMSPEFWALVRWSGGWASPGWRVAWSDRGWGPLRSRGAI